MINTFPNLMSSINTLHHFTRNLYPEQELMREKHYFCIETPKITLKLKSVFTHRNIFF